MDERITEAQKRKRAMQALLHSEGWRMLSAIIKSQVEQRAALVLLTPIGEKFTVTEQEFTKGEIAGLRLAIGMCEQLLTDANNVLAIEDQMRPADDDNDE